MDGFNEKKWFVYLGDHHEGPFSLAEIQGKMSQSQVTTANYVWAEGLTDWKPMTAVPEFEALLNVGQGHGVAHLRAVPPLAAGAEGSEPSLVSIPAPTLSEVPPVNSEPSLAPVVTVLEETTAISPVSPPNEKTFRADLAAVPTIEVDAKAPRSSVPARKAGSRGFKWAVFFLLLAGLIGAAVTGTLDPLLQSPSAKAAKQAAIDLVQPKLLLLSEKVPALGKWISPIPALEDVAPEDYEGLKEAAVAKLEVDGPRIGVAPSHSDPFAPTFYVSTNLPDGALLDIYVEGVPETLLNQLSFSGKAQATIDRKLGKSGPVRYPDGKPLPRGEYWVHVTENSQQPEIVHSILSSVQPSKSKIPPGLPVGLRLLASKQVFLGGNKDASYASRLKEFHDRLTAKATAELAEIKQLSLTLDGQLSATNTKYAQLRKVAGKGKPSFAARKAWADFSVQWSKLDAQLREGYNKWTDQALATEYFYGVLYALAKTAGDSISKLNQMQGDYFAGKVDPKAFEIQQGSAVSQAESSLSALKSKISQAENLAPTPNGMPRREGL